MGSSRLFNDPYTPSPTLPSSSHPYERGHLCNLLFPPYLTYINPIPSQFPHSSLPFHLSQAKLSPSSCSHSLMRLKRRALEAIRHWLKEEAQARRTPHKASEQPLNAFAFSKSSSRGWMATSMPLPALNECWQWNKPLLDLTYSANENWTSAIVVLTRFCCE